MKSISKKLLLEIMNFLPLKDICNLSSSNKKLNSMIKSEELCPKTNNLWFENCITRFIDLENGLNPTILTDIYSTQSQINWNQLTTCMINHKKNLLNDKENLLKTIIYDSLKYHCYLPPLRKSNILIERINMSNHQMYFIDQYKRESSNLFNGKETFNLIDHLHVTNEDIKEIYCSQKYSEFILRIANYNYSPSYTNFSSVKIDNKIIYFLAWFYQAIVLHCVMVYHYLLRINCNDGKNYKEFINEYANLHMYFIDSALTIDSKLTSLNYIINKLYRNFNQDQDQKKNFSIYKLMISVWYSEVYLKIKQNLLESIKNNLIPSFINDEIEKKIKNNYYSDSSNEQNFNFYEQTNKELLEKITTCILDFSINETNACILNSSIVELTHEYNDLENILLNQISQKIGNDINSEHLNKKSVMSLIKNINCNWNFINRTKILLITNIMIELKNYLCSIIIKKEINEFISNKSNFINKCLNSNGQKGSINSRINNDMNCLCNLLVFAGFSLDLIKEYITFSKMENIFLLKGILADYYEILETYENRNLSICKYEKEIKNKKVGNVVRKLSCGKEYEKELVKYIQNKEFYNMMKYLTVI